MTTQSKRMTKEQYKQQRIAHFNNLKEGNQKVADFKVKKLQVSSNDPVISTVNRVLQSIK